MRAIERAGATATGFRSVASVADVSPGSVRVIEVD
jgi:hypothetical protein